MSKEIEVEAALENCRALINQINAALSAEKPFVNASSAAELLLHLESAAAALKKSFGPSPPERPSIIGGADGPPPANPSAREQVCC